MSQRLDGVRVACITVLGSGFAPFASGSWGSLVAVLLFAILWTVCTALHAPRGALEAATVIGIVVACVLSVVWGKWAVARFGSKDPKPFVLDEFAGQWIALLAAPVVWPLGGFALDVRWLGVLGSQFLLFRFFDVLKPPPARQMERLPDGWGILLDDLFAGLMANLVGQFAWRVLLPLAGY